MKTKLFLMAAIAAIVTMASCGNNDDDATINGASDYAIILNSSNIANNVSTYSLKEDIQLTQFQADEKIDVFINEDVASNPSTSYDQPLIYTANGSGGMAAPTNKQPYFPSSGKGVNIVAVYPSEVATSATATVQFSIKTDQSSDADYKAGDLMYGTPESNPVARTSSSIEIKFNHLLSKINIELVSGTGSPDLGGAKVRLKAVKPTTEFNVTSGTITGATGDAADILVMTIPDNASDLKGSAIIIPQGFAGGASFIEVELSSGTKMTYKLPSEGVTMTGKNVYNYKITVKKSELTVYSSINDWTSNDIVTGDAEEEIKKDQFIPEKMPDLIAVPIKAGTFGMGVPGSSSVTIYHTVTLTKKYYMSQYEITNKQFAIFLNANNIGNDGYNGDNNPMLRDCKNESEAFRWGLTWRNNKWEVYSADKENYPASYISWFGAKAFAEWVGGDLPTEAEWENACRAGTTTTYSFGDEDYNEYMWSKENSTVEGTGQPHAVGLKKPNNWGLYDMHGNVEEWCLDKYNNNYTASSTEEAANPVTDPYNNTPSITTHIARGGRYSLAYTNCGSGTRLWGSGPGNMNDYNGFRVVFKTPGN